MKKSKQNSPKEKQPETNGTDFMMNAVTFIGRLLTYVEDHKVSGEGVVGLMSGTILFTKHADRPAMNRYLVELEHLLELTDREDG